MTTPTLRVMLVSPALNPALREARFDGDTPLDPSGARAARTAAPHLPAADRYAAGASARCRATARELGLGAPDDLEVAPAGWQLGRWSGLRLDEVAATEPEGVAAWASDPAAAPHGGESLGELLDRSAPGWTRARGTAGAGPRRGAWSACSPWWNRPSSAPPSPTPWPFRPPPSGAWTRAR